VRNVLVGLLWLWLVVSLGVYAYRLYRRFTRPKGLVADVDDTAATATADAPVIGSDPAVRPDPLGRPSPVPAPVDPAPVVPPRVTPPVALPPEGGAGRSGLFAPTPPAPPASDATPAAGSEARPTVADVLSGITMPCDLAPVIDPTRIADPFRVAFSTHTATAATVGAAVGDELERLQFALQSTSANQLAATKAGQQVVVTIHPDPESVQFGEGRAFPTMPPDSVVVEFHT
jgi:hypothetical protein